MPKKSPTRAELETELRLVRRQRAAGSIASVINNVVRWAGCCVIAYFAYRSVDALAGQQTTADIGINLLGKFELSDVFAVLFGGGGLFYGVQQKRLRQSTVERLQGRVRGFEKDKDRDRTSSGLTPRGETNPEDM